MFNINELSEFKIDEYNCSYRLSDEKLYRYNAAIAGEDEPYDSVSLVLKICLNINL